MGEGASTQQRHCVFCAIVAGRAPASVVYRDRATVAFMDVNPVRPGHVLVIPTAHRAQVWELGEAESAAVYRRLPALASALKAAMAADAVTVISLNGRAAGQTCSTSTFTWFPCTRQIRSSGAAAGA